MTHVNFINIKSDKSTSFRADSYKSDIKSFTNSVVALGVFDGLHIGHRHLIDTTIQKSRYHSTNSAILTFDIDPDELFKNKSLIKLSDNNQRIIQLIDSGVDDVFILQFTNIVASLTPIEFLTSIFDDNLPHTIVIGENFKFGCNASGDVDTLKKWGFDKGVEIIAVPLIQSDGEPVSSSRIRRLITQKDLDNANKLLGKQFKSQ